MNRVMVKLPNSVVLPVRYTPGFHRENGSRKMIHLHVSIAVLNERIGE